MWVAHTGADSDPPAVIGKTSPATPPPTTTWFTSLSSYPPPPPLCLRECYARNARSAKFSMSVTTRTLVLLRRLVVA